MRATYILSVLLIVLIQTIKLQHVAYVNYNVDFNGPDGCSCGPCKSTCFTDNTQITRYIDFTEFPPSGFNVTRFQITPLALNNTYDGRVHLAFGYPGMMTAIGDITAPQRSEKCQCDSNCPIEYYTDVQRTNEGIFPYSENSTLEIHIFINKKDKPLCLTSLNLMIQLNILPVPPTDSPTVAPTTTPTNTTKPTHKPTVSPKMKKMSLIVVIVCSIIIALASVLGLLYCWKMKIEKMVEDNTYSSISNTRNLSRIGDLPNDSVVFDDDDLVIEETIGKGSFGNVYRATWTGTEVAVKSLHVKQNSEEKQDFIREVSLLSALRHPNIVQFLGTHTKNDGDLYMIFEYMPKGSLFEIIHDHSIDLQWKRIKDICMDATKGMIYLHSCNPIVIHRDLKSHNLLVDDYWRVKVCDFGLSRLAPQSQTTMTACGTPAWSAPELLKGEKYDEKIDVYSFSIICWELIMREIPYKGLDTFQIIYQVGTKNIRPRLPEDLNLLQKKRGIPTSFVTLMTTCWDTDDSKRPSFKEISELLKKM